jgi:cytosolic 5'-nucleotidase 3
MSIKKGRIVVVDQKKFAWQVKELKKQGAKNLQVVSDFDRTITKCFVNGKRSPSLIGILREDGYLSANYARQAYRLFNYYHPIEINTKLSLSFKKKKMQEWWQKHFELLIKERLNKQDIYQAMTESKLKLRPGGEALFNKLKDSQVPFLIFSASGLGELSIEIFLRKRSLLLNNVFIISNSFFFNEKERLVGIKKPIIHVYNKDEKILNKYPFYQKIKDRKNIIVIGDSLGDANMHKGLKHEQVLKIGFLNENEELSLPAYRQVFDVLILGDASFYHLNQIFKQILS